MLSIGETVAEYVRSAAKRAQRAWWRTLLLGVLAGVFIALAGAASAVAAAAGGGAEIGRLLSAAVFPAGLMLVSLTGAELFTGNCLMVMAPLGAKLRFRDMLKVLALSYAGNLIGALLTAALTVGSGMFSGAAGAVLASCAVAKAGLSFMDAFVRGVLCNVLVCAAVLTAVSARSLCGRLAALFFPVMLFVLSGFEHSVANMFYLPAAAMLSRAPIGTAAGETLANLVPVTLGNIVGGAGLFALPIFFAHGGEKE